MQMGVGWLLFHKRRRHFFFKVRICFSCRRELYTSCFDGNHHKMTNKHLRSAIVIMNMGNNIRPIIKPTRHELSTTAPFARFLLLQLCISFVYMELTWTRMDCQTKRSFFKYNWAFFYSSWKPISSAHLENKFGSVHFNIQRYETL